MSKIVILGNPDSWYARDLQRAAGTARIDVLSFRDLQAHLVGTTARIVSRRSATRSDATDTIELAECDHNNNDRTLAFDAVLVRTMPLGSLEQVIFRMNALHAIEHCGTPVFNPARCLETAIDKWMTLEVLQRAGLPAPRTHVCQIRSDAIEAFHQLGQDVVVKPLFGGEGRGIMRVNDPEMAWRVFGTLEQLQAVMYLQEFLPHAGHDLRLLVVGQKIFAVRRVAKDDWRTNLSRGGEAIPHAPTAHQCELAMRAAQAIGGSIVGVDILPTRDGQEVILEVNGVPGWKGTARALEIDIASEIVEHLVTASR